MSRFMASIDFKADILGFVIVRIAILKPIGLAGMGSMPYVYVDRLIAADSRLHLEQIEQMNSYPLINNLD